MYDEPYSSYRCVLRPEKHSLADKSVPEGQDGLFYAGPVGSGQSGLSERGSSGPYNKTFPWAMCGASTASIWLESRLEGKNANSSPR